MYAIARVLQDYEEVQGIKILKVVKTEEEAKAWIAETTDKESKQRDEETAICRRNLYKFAFIEGKQDSRKGEILYRAWIGKGIEGLVHEMLKMNIDTNLITKVGIESLPFGIIECVNNFFYDKIPKEYE